MMDLNLVYPEKSDIEFKINRFPDGQQDVVLTSPEKIIDNYVRIKSRFNSFKDLELIICATKALKNYGIENNILYIPYLLGARSDRKFAEGGTSYLRDIIAPIINAQNFKWVRVIDPHSEVAEAVIHRLEKDTNLSLVDWALSHIHRPFYIVSPDAGALKKIYDIAASIGYHDEIVTCSKHREIATGKILSTIVPKEDFEGKDVIIIDDICDGGRTFIEMAKIIRERNVVRIYLVVTHGIFSAGFIELNKYFDAIFTTNSVKDIDVLSYSDYTVNEDFLKQLNVF